MHSSCRQLGSELSNYLSYLIETINDYYYNIIILIKKNILGLLEKKNYCCQKVDTVPDSDISAWLVRSQVRTALLVCPPKSHCSAVSH